MFDCNSEVVSTVLLLLNAGMKHLHCMLLRMHCHPMTFIIFKIMWAKKNCSFLQHTTQLIFLRSEVFPCVHEAVQWSKMSSCAYSHARSNRHGSRHWREEVSKVQDYPQYFKIKNYLRIMSCWPVFTLDESGFWKGRVSKYCELFVAQFSWKSHFAVTVVWWTCWATKGSLNSWT